MHIFLTGGIRAGKTTIIRSFIKQSGLSADGFLTYWEPNYGDNRYLYLSPYSKKHPPPEKHLLVRDGESRYKQAGRIRNVFDTLGVEILKNSGKRDVVIMDELGFLESRSLLFQSAVLWHIYADTPVLGVIKPARNTFLNMIRAQPNVMVRNVTEENRDAVLEWLLSEFENTRRIRDENI